MTDAVYLRPHVAYASSTAARPGVLSAEVAAIASRARCTPPARPAATSPLGVEIDRRSPTAAATASAPRLEYAVAVPARRPRQPRAPPQRQPAQLVAAAPHLHVLTMRPQTLLLLRLVGPRVQREPELLRTSTTGTRPGASTPLECVPNLDGRIDASELKAALNTSVKYQVSPGGTTRAVDVAGTPDRYGRPHWNFADGHRERPGDQIEATPLQGELVRASFPNGQSSSRRSTPGRRSRAVYYAGRPSHVALRHRVAPAEPVLGRDSLRLLVADSSSTSFPLTAGSSWTSSGTMHERRLLNGEPYAGQDTYDDERRCDGHARPAAAHLHSSHRVRRTVTVAPAVGESVVTKQVSFLYECFGEVARATEPVGETKRRFHHRRRGAPTRVLKTKKENEMLAGTSGRRASTLGKAPRRSTSSSVMKSPLAARPVGGDDHGGDEDQGRHRQGGGGVVGRRWGCPPSAIRSARSTP